MFERLRRRLNYANVVATLALFVALGGSSYAVTKISGSQLKNRSVAGKKLKRNTLGARQINESRLGTVRRAGNADRLNGFDAGQLVERLVLRCPEGTFAAADVCVETQPRAPNTYGTAIAQCAAADGLPGPGRRLPTYNELRMAATSDIAQFTPGGELTSHIYPSGSSPTGYGVLSMTDEAGAVALLPGGFDGQRPFRCVVDPRN
jgi:hypothetical protein